MTAWGRVKKKGSAAKFGNDVSLCAQGHSHASKLESAVCQILHLRAKAGEIKNIQVQDHIYLTAARIGYVPDFKCEDNKGVSFWVESKGFPNDKWPMKKKLWKFYGPGRLEIWTGNYKNPQLTEEIIPIVLASPCESCAQYQELKEQNFNLNQLNERLAQRLAERVS